MKFDASMLNRKSAEPLYLQIYRILRRYAEAHTGETQIFLPSTVELAARFAVAQNTIRQTMRMLTEARLVCRIRHRGTILTSGQLPEDPQADGRSIGLVFPAEGYDSWQPMLRIMHREAEICGFSLDIYLYKWNTLADERRALVRAVKNCSGIILYPNSEGSDRALIAEFNTARPPLELFLLYYDDLESGIVACNNSLAAYELTCRLIRAGARKVAFIHDYPMLKTPRLRLEGYRNALVDNNLNFTESLVFDPRQPGFLKTLRQAAPDALLCCCGLESQIAEWSRGIDRSHIAFFSVPYPPGVRLPGILAALVPAEELGKTAIEECVRRIHHGQLPVRKILINLKILVTGKSLESPSV